MDLRPPRFFFEHACVNTSESRHDIGHRGKFNVSYIRPIGLPQVYFFVGGGPKSIAKL